MSWQRHENSSVSAPGVAVDPGLVFCVSSTRVKRERETVHRGRGPQTGKSQVYGPRILKLPILQGIEQWKCNVMSPVGFRSWRSQIVTLAVARGACQAHTGLREIDEADLKPLGVGKMLVVKVACNGEPWWANDTYCCQYAAFAMRRVWLALILVNNNQINIMYIMVARIHVRSHLANLPRPHFTLHGGFVGNPPNWHLFWFEFKDF